MSYKQDQVESRNATRRIVSLYEGDSSELHNDDGSLTYKGLITLQNALNSPQEHHTVDLGIKAFKRYLKRIPMMTKTVFNQQVRLYKEKARQDYIELIKYKGSFPTMPA